MPTAFHLIAIVDVFVTTEQVSGWEICGSNY